ncbi:MAG: maleylpyruvate isomerase [Geobacteraceae bacterium]|nr:maleylpyruvate isomerase [Geobacteraceae bacterium]
MTTSRGKQLAEIIGQKVEALKQVCLGVDENLAGRAPAERWAPKEILSHLCGPEGVGHLPLLKAFVDSDCPKLVLDAGNPFYAAKRAAMSFIELVAECEQNYRQVAGFVGGLTDEQLARTAHIPELKDSPLGEYPTLDGMIYGLGEYHIQFHIDHLGEILEVLAA